MGNSAVSLANAVAAFLDEFQHGLPERGSKGVAKFRDAYGSLPKVERDRYRRHYRSQYEAWIGHLRPNPTAVAEQAEMFDTDTLTAGVRIEDRHAHWEGRTPFVPKGAP